MSTQHLYIVLDSTHVVVTAHRNIPLITQARTCIDAFPALWERRRVFVRTKNLADVPQKFRRFIKEAETEYNWDLIAGVCFRLENGSVVTRLIEHRAHTAA